MRIVKMIMLWILCYAGTIGVAAAASLAVFPLQELGEGRNDGNLELSRLLTSELARGDHAVVAMDTVLAFMAHNRIRTLGHLESYHITRARIDLGAAYVLVGTVSQRRERPEPSLGITLNLIRTSDARTVWTHVGGFSSSQERRLLGIGEPDSVEELQRLLVADLMDKWPTDIIRTARTGATSVLLDMARVEPRQLRPGEELRTQARMREHWTGNYLPQVSFEVGGQRYPAQLGDDGLTYSGYWPAQGNDGSYPVNLLLEWPAYERTEKVLLGDYRVDGSAPVVTMALRGALEIDGEAVFNRQVEIIPRLLIRKPLSRWRLAFYAESGQLIGDMEGEGSLPEQFVWEGRSSYGRADDGRYRIVLNVWDMAGNPARAEHWLGLNRSLPKVAAALEGRQEAFQVDLSHEGRVPLDFWRMELWSRDGTVIARQEGQQLPVSVALGAANLDDLQGFVFAQDVLGNQIRQDVRDLLPELMAPPEEEIQEQQRVLTERWVDEF